MDLVASLQSKLDEVQSRIDSKIDSSLPKFKGDDSTKKEEEEVKEAAARNEIKISLSTLKDEPTNLRAALLNLRLESLESQRSALAKARATVTAAQRLRDRAESVVTNSKNARNKRIQKDKKKLLKPLEKIEQCTKDLVQQCFGLVQDADRAKSSAEARIMILERDGKALADAASTALAETNKKLNVLQAERDAYGAEHISTLRTRLDAAEKRAESSASVAKDALNELDRERTNRKSRELAATKSLNNQLTAARADARDAKQKLQDLRAEMDAKLEKQKIEHEKALQVAIADQSQIAQNNLLQIQNEHQQLYVQAQKQLQDAKKNYQQLQTEADRATSQADHTISNLRHQLQQANQQLQALQQHSAFLESQSKTTNEKRTTSSKKKNTIFSKKSHAPFFRVLLLLYVLALHILVYFTFSQCSSFPISSIRKSSS
uniref:Uncharacterized protein n=1 Tax=Aureoumbra lagunensis TaxID=44058 RepID=A0A7S3NLB5_9STRA